MNAADRHHYQLPIEFVSPYPLQESLIRLEAKRGEYLGTEISVGLSTSDEQTYEFHVGLRNGGGRNSTLVDVEAVGYLQAWGDTGTKIVVEQSRLGRSIRFTGLFVFLIAAGIATFILMQLGLSFLPIILIAVPAVAFLATWVWWLSERSSSLTKLMNIIEDTLVYSSSGKGKKKRRW